MTDQTPESVARAIDAGERPHAARLARQLAETADSDAMLALADVLARHAMYAALIDAWRRRDPLPERERGPLANALNALAMQHSREGRADEAVTALTEALELTDTLPYIRRNLASCLLQKGEFVGAMAELDTLLSAEPENPESLLLLGVARYQSGDPELAIEPLEQAFANGGADAGLWLLKALCIAGRMDEARNVKARWLDANPDRAAAMLDLELAEPGSPLHALG